MGVENRGETQIIDKLKGDHRYSGAYVAYQIGPMATTEQISAISVKFANEPYGHILTSSFYDFRSKVFGLIHSKYIEEVSDEQRENLQRYWDRPANRIYAWGTYLENNGISLFKTDRRLWVEFQIVKLADRLSTKNK